MNTTTTPLRLTAATSAVALAVILAGWAAAPAAAGESRPQVASEDVVTSAMHRALLQEEADRYLNSLLVHARMALEEGATAPSIDVVLTPVGGS